MGDGGAPILDRNNARLSAEMVFNFRYCTLMIRVRRTLSALVSLQRNLLTQIGSSTCCAGRSNLLRRLGHGLLHANGVPWGRECSQRRRRKRRRRAQMHRTIRHIVVGHEGFVERSERRRWFETRVLQGRERDLDRWDRRKLVHHGDDFDHS